MARSAQRHHPYSQTSETLKGIWPDTPNYGRRAYIDPPNHPNVGQYASPISRVWGLPCQLQIVTNPRSRVECTPGSDWSKVEHLSLPERIRLNIDQRWLWYALVWGLQKSSPHRVWVRSRVIENPWRLDMQPWSRHGEELLSKKTQRNSEPRT